MKKVEWWWPAAGRWGNWGDVGHSHRVRNFSYAERISFRDLMYSIVTIDNHNNVLYTLNLLRE